MNPDRISQPIYLDVGDDYGRIELVDYMGHDQRVIDAARVSFAQDMLDAGAYVEHLRTLDGLKYALNKDGYYFDNQGNWSRFGPHTRICDTEQDALCYRWRGEKDDKLLRYLIRNEHWSPLEHCAITWHIVVPLFVARQWHRHRVWSYAEVSRRYTSDDLEFFCPNHFRPQAEKNKQASNWGETFDPPVLGRGPASNAVTEHVQRSVELYESMLRQGISREQARMILPQNMYTRFYGTVNLRNALAFIQLRYDNHAQLEIFQAAKVMRDHLDFLFPATLEAYEAVAQERKQVHPDHQRALELARDALDELVGDSDLDEHDSKAMQAIQAIAGVLV